MTGTSTEGGLGDMSTDEIAEEPPPVGTAFQHICPHWCVVHDVGQEAEEHGEVVHVSGPVVVNGTVLGLASSVDCETGACDGPVVYVGGHEYTLYQGEVLIDALTHLVDEGSGHTQFIGGHRRPEGTTGDR